MKYMYHAGEPQSRVDAAVLGRALEWVRQTIATEEASLVSAQAFQVRACMHTRYSRIVVIAAFLAGPQACIPAWPHWHGGDVFPCRTRRFASCVRPRT